LSIHRCLEGAFQFGGQGAAEWGFRGHGLLGLDCQIQAKNGEARLVAFNLFGCRIARSGRSRWNGRTLKPFETRPNNLDAIALLHRFLHRAIISRIV